jgi:hypothetical protein
LPGIASTRLAGVRIVALDEIQLRENATVALLRRPGIPTVTAGCAGFEQHRQRRAAVQELPFA